MNLTMMQGHIGSEKAQIQRSATTQAIRIKLATTVDHFLRDNDLDFAYVYLSTFVFHPHSFQPFPGFFSSNTVSVSSSFNGQEQGWLTRGIKHRKTLHEPAMTVLRDKQGVSSTDKYCMNLQWPCVECHLWFHKHANVWTKLPSLLFRFEGRHPCTQHASAPKPPAFLEQGESRVAFRNVLSTLASILNW